MFTGLVADLGTIKAIRQTGENWTLTVRTAFDMASVEMGESIAVNGACLTVTQMGDDTFSVEASPETLRRTTLGDRKVGDKVHLERALRMGDRLGGHMVLGHVDGVGKLVAKRREKNAWLLDFDAPEQVARYLIEKGSVAIDGVSLTVNTVDANRFGVAIIPHTSEHTNLTDYAVGRRVNLESDVIGKYVEKFVSPKGEGISRKMLEDFGF
ncbi:riboflavin synthase [Persicimonas caeni]|uniref:Riboflavin synthase n=1 Tax=Persicimonas caeni TaxID=2292766 RepID=A0A4Y6Q0K5_PERCE|nr:riboflavin synthase [Persicimonas caeni]QDG53767.1 riboflavin synthase [Persicimonas caeni]QED34988.1 riboflavin synthase [Persicimonas caeni]